MWGQIDFPHGGKINKKIKYKKFKEIIIAVNSGVELLIGGQKTSEGYILKLKAFYVTEEVFTSLGFGETEKPVPPKPPRKPKEKKMPKEPKAPKWFMDWSAEFMNMYKQDMTRLEKKMDDGFAELKSLPTIAKELKKRNNYFKYIKRHSLTSVFL